MNFCKNHLKEYDGYYKDLFEFNHMEFRKKPKVIISQILSGSTIKKDNIIIDGDLIVSINDEKIEKVRDLMAEVGDMKKSRVSNKYVKE